MSRELSSCENSVDPSNGAKQAHPAGAADGGDTQGRCVPPEDNSQQDSAEVDDLDEIGFMPCIIEVRLPVVKKGAVIQSGIFGRLERLFPSPKASPAKEKSGEVLM